ncbi:MAG: radical SAM protein [Planctomycetes bacterium]|nr:radical SAM protein [Planctomycetota bacterium]
MDTKTLKVILAALAFPKRDLSPALVSLAEFARQDKTLSQAVEINLQQFLYTDNAEGIVDGLCQRPADVYGFSCYVWNIHQCMQVARAIKSKLPQAIILLGGPEASGLAKYLLECYPFVDYIVKDEGEEPFTKFLLSQVGGLNLSQVPALVYRNESGTTIENPKTAAVELAVLPSSFSSAYYLNYLGAVKEPVTITFETSRGCPFGCRYCTWGGRRVRFHQLERVFAELSRMLNHPSVGRIYITDSDILINRQRGKAILNFLLAHNRRRIPVIFEVNPEVLDDETTDLIAQFGEDEFAFGLQSSSPTVLKSINRRFNPTRYRQNIVKLKESNPDIRIWFSLIIGLPGDCLTTFKESLAFAVSMSPHSMYIHEFLCLPGSEFFNNQDKYGILCQTEAPHKLLYHRTFGRKDYLAVKELGFYVSLFHYYKWIKEPLLTLWQASGEPATALLSYYERFVEFLRNRIDLTGGKNVKEIPSFLFDEYYQRIVADQTLGVQLQALFDEFYAMLEQELENKILVFGETTI